MIQRKPLIHKKKKGQATSILIFFGLIVAIFIVSIIILRLTNEILTPFSATIGNMSTTAGTAVENVHNSFTNWWDIAIILIFGINVILLLVSSFLVDVHPAFLIVYIVAVIFMFIFGNYVLSAMDNIWNMVGTSTEEAQTPLQQFFINHFQIIMMGVVILSGVVMYAKMKFFGNMGAGGGGY